MVALIALFLLALVAFYLLRYWWERFEIEDFAKKAVFITGCDSGFGRLLALKCAANGFHVFAGCLTRDGEESLRAESKGKVVTLPLNVTDDDSVKQAAETVEKSLKTGVDFWALVNNAGVFTCYGPDDWCTIEDYKYSYDVNTLGIVRTTHAFKPLLKRSRGRIITVTSVAGRMSSPCAGPYSAAKYAAESYMDTIRQELRPFGVTCCILEPGAFKTNLLDQRAMEKRVDNAWNRLDDEQKKEYGSEYKKNFVLKWNEILHTFGTSRTDYVVDNYYHAISARFPRLRYLCGWDALFFYGPLTHLPTEIADFLLWLITRFSFYPPPPGSLK
ncbi:hypothetical protein QR680_009704 [Steinernema hermaphroditum]|uniref:17-beta-hydroxysteroid dehydrogenase type 6 n=1 Tax=Steinernema hermaphroditum TaxID=289476 RepID=A0AA39ILD5_9BILA|nr:hypothetical protein QR680_009704 [Steinernema hermaphroditum]